MPTQLLNVLSKTTLIFEDSGISRLWNQLPIKLKKEARTVASFRNAFTDIFLLAYDEVEHFGPNAI